MPVSYLCSICYVYLFNFSNDHDVKIKIILFRDKVCILIKILVEDHWAFVLGNVKIDDPTYRLKGELYRSVFLFRARATGTTQLWMDSKQMIISYQLERKKLSTVNRCIYQWNANICNDYKLNALILTYFLTLGTSAQHYKENIPPCVCH